MSERTDELRARIKCLREQLRAAEAELTSVKESECQIKVGNVVRHKRTGKDYIVRRVKFFEFFDAPSCLKVSQKRENGEWSDREVSLYSGEYEPVS